MREPFKGASADADRATAAEPVVSALRDGIPSAGFGECSVTALAAMIAAFRLELPGWWFTVGECSVSADASCGPDRGGPDAHLLKLKEFDEGFHADLPQPARMVDALANVTAQAIEARQRQDAETGLARKGESAVARPCAQTTGGEE